MTVYLISPFIINIIQSDSVDTSFLTRTLQMAENWSLVSVEQFDHCNKRAINKITTLQPTSVYVGSQPFIAVKPWNGRMSFAAINKELFTAWGWQVATLDWSFSCLNVRNWLMWRNILWLVLWRICFINLKGPFITNSSTLQQIAAVMLNAGFQSGLQVKNWSLKFKCYFVSVSFILMLLKFSTEKPF